MLSSCQRFYRIIQWQMFTIFVAMIALPYVTGHLDYKPELALSNMTVSKTRYFPTENLITEHDEADLHFNIQFNVSNTFKWTTKEVYLGLIAVWNDSVGLQEQTVWDKTIYYTDNESFFFSEKQQSKYPLRSYEGVKLPGCEIHFRFVLYEVGFGGRFRTTTYEMEETVTVK
ncbi:Signal_peptidase subunit [Hexamita inflata]|uniref:Signal peptidase complex subunit 3 n=1 Tax=Hexamita inflata TaxID=28002 RepID=A0AA86U735_9EUKA|nr:Signal peptidase subunit [Hexamita inflata]